MRNKAWIYITSLAFGLAGGISLVITDAVITPDSLYFSREPFFFISCSVPPAFFSFFAANRWLVGNSTFFRGWLSVAVAAWLSLVINPIIWALVIFTAFLYGMISISILLATGSLLGIAWHFFGNADVGD